MAESPRPAKVAPVKNLVLALGLVSPLVVFALTLYLPPASDFVDSFSAPFLSLLINGNVDWLPMLAFLLPAQWGIAILLSKPQAGLMAGLVWFKRARRKDLFLVPAIGLFLASILVWGWWVPRMVEQSLRVGGKTMVGFWNIAPFPWLIPIGVWLLYQAWKREDELIAVAATLCLVPYFAIYSLTVFLQCWQHATRVFRPSPGLSCGYSSWSCAGL